MPANPTVVGNALVFFLLAFLKDKDSNNVMLSP